MYSVTHKLIKLNIHRGVKNWDKIKNSSCSLQGELL